MPENTHPFSPEIVDQLVKDTLPMGYIYWDGDGNGLGCCSNALDFFGLKTPKEVFDYWDQLSPMFQPNGNASQDCFEKMMTLAGTNGKAVLDWQFRSIYGELIPAELTCVRHNIDGNDVRIAYIRDRRALQEVRRNTEVENFRFLSILRSCPICFAMLTEDRFTFVTPFMSNFLGVKVGDSFRSLFADAKTVERLCEDPKNNDLISWLPVTIQSNYGDRKEMLAYTLRLDFPDEAERILWLIDVTQSRKFERELKTAKDLAEASTKAKSKFLADMSHEIRTPMNAIIGLTHLTLRTSLTEQQTEYIQTVQQSTHILLRLINDILDFSKIEAGRMLLEYREFSIGSVIADISAVADSLLQKKNLDFQIEVDTNIPPSVMGDSVRLHQVIMNLISNAIKFTEEGVVRLKIAVVEADILSTVLRFSVTDSGIGMTPSQVKGLFQPFTQASSSTTRKFGGTGLGLVIAKQIVELMRGQLSCESEVGKGTTFSFTARFGIPLEGEVVNVEESTETKASALLVGDSPQDQAAIQHCIELLGLGVYQTGASLSEFNNFLDTEQMKSVNFILFDLMDLPASFSLMYAALLDKQLDPMPLIVLAEHPNYESVLTTLGIQDSVLTLKKPVTPKDLFNVMAKAAAHREELIQLKKATKSQLIARYKGEVVVPKSLHGAKVLLAEDNKINQLVATELLRVEGFEATVADNGQIAVELLKKQKFDIILMDVQMPEMDGFEATRAIRAMEQFKDIPILAMTANAMTGDRELCIEAGMNDHIAKPIDPQVLYRALVKWIKSPEKKTQ